MSKIKMNICGSDLIFIGLFIWLAIDGNPAWWLACVAVIGSWFLPEKEIQLFGFSWKRKEITNPAVLAAAFDPAVTPAVTPSPLYSLPRYGGQGIVMSEEMKLIQPAPVVRDEHGFWTHPSWPSTDDELIPYSCFDDRGLDIKQVYFEYDASETLQAAWYHDGTADCTTWNPSQPAGDGWFIFSIHDTEDGPICVWVRHRVAV